MRFIFTLAICSLLVFASATAHQRYRYDSQMSPNEQIEIDLCPGSHVVYCFLSPCRFAKCPGHPSAVCRPNYCGGCHARFYEENTEIECGRRGQRGNRSMP